MTLAPGSMRVVENPERSGTVDGKRHPFVHASSRDAVRAAPYCLMEERPEAGRRGTIAVVGATGRQGSAVVRHLLDQGWKVRALTRKPSGRPARVLRERGSDVARVDTEDAGLLREVIDGVDGLFNVQNPMTSSNAAELRQGMNVAEAAAEAGVGHVVYGAAGVRSEPTGVSSWDAKLVVARRFRALDLPLTVLRPMAFMELMTDRGFYPGLAAWHVMPKLMGRTRPVGWLCIDDLGAIAARVFDHRERWVDTELSLAADVRSIDQCRTIWRELHGHSPRGVPIPVGLFERMAGSDLPTMWRWLCANDVELSTATTRQLLPGALTVREWVSHRITHG